MKLQPQKWVMVLAGGLALALASFARAQSGTNQQPPLPPLPVVKSPVDAFRELLAMDSAAQRAALTNRSAESRQKLVEKIREYQRMDPDDRELRLVATELRWYLPQFMSLAAPNRVERFADLRPDLRELLESRLTRWDALPEELRAQYLRNESALALLLHVGTASDRLRQQLVNEVAPEMRATLNQALARLDAMSPVERTRAFDVFENIFAMNPAEKAGALRVMSEAEQRQMEQTLAAFGKLTLEQRRQCLRSYEKFAGMNPDERALFLRNVQVWEKMSPKERQEWRELVKHIDLLPPLPERKILLPPVPPDPPIPRITTNRT